MIQKMSLKNCGMAFLGGCVGLLILALAPTLLRQASSNFTDSEQNRARLIEIKPADEIQPEELEIEPPPPELEIEPEVPDMETPEIELETPEMETPDFQPTIDMPPISLEMPSLSAIGVQGIAVNAKNLSQGPIQSGMPELPQHGPPKTRFNQDEVDQQTKAVATSQPVYPYRAKKLKINGAVTVRFLVETSGETNLIEIVKSDPLGEFEAAVEQAVRKWKFEPAMKDNRPVASWVQTTIEFNLR